MDSALVVDTDTATLAWLVIALEQARQQSHTKIVDYLEVVMEDVVFEAEAAPRRRGHM